MKKPNKSWLSLLLALCNVLCAAAVILICVRVHVDTDNIRQQAKETAQSMTDIQEKVAALETKIKEQEEEQAKAQAEEAQNIEENTEEQRTSEENNAGSNAETAVQTSSEENKEGAGNEKNGKTVAIDPGHQGSWVDMSAQEPNGPGSSEMKAKCSTGTEGTYSGIPEYQLNLDVSLKLKQVLENRGYKVVMTRTDNDAAISNAERAQLAYDQGADIYVRVHANGDDTHTASGALTMGPSADNPYVGNMYGECQRLCQCILDSYCQATGFQSLGVQHYDNMTGINWSQIPVTIIEMGFMTSEHDDLQMADSEFQQVMVEGIANGIDAYFS